MGATAPSLIARRRRPEAAVSGESGFVLILVLPVALMLIMTALSLVTRSNSAALASTRETRAQGARMAAEYGFLEMMARVNSEYNSSLPNSFPNSFLDTENVIPPGALQPLLITSYTILKKDFTPPVPATPCDPIKNEGDDFNVKITGTLKAGTNTYTQTITRSIRVCSPSTNSNQLRIRAFS